MVMMKLRSYATLLLFITIVSIVSFSAAQFTPGQWYVQLIKPEWTPPNWIFPVAWTLLYLMIAVAGWLIFKHSNRIMQIAWVAQLVFNALWSWLFFGLHWIGVAMFDIFAMFVCILVLVWSAYKTNAAVFWLMTPYLLWVSYALALNAAIFFLNPL